MTSANREYCLKPIIIVAADENLSSIDLSHYQNKIQTCMKLVQAVVNELLQIQGFSGHVLSLDSKDEIDVFTSIYTVSQLHNMNKNFIWESLAREIFTLLGKYTPLKIIGFLTCTKYLKVDKDLIPRTYVEVLRRTRGYAMCAVGGFGLIGIATHYAWPSAIKDIPKHVKDKTIVDRTKYQDGCCMRGTWGSCYTSTMGAILHEILHLFDILHCKEGIMGQGFMDMDKFLLQHFLKGATELHRSKIELLRGKTTLVVFNETRMKEFGGFYLDRVSLVTLALSKYLNKFEDINVDIKRFGSSLSSPVGLRFISIRNGDMTIRHWEFLGNIPPKVFTVPTLISSCELVVFVIDSFGNTAKFNWL